MCCDSGSARNRNKPGYMRGTPRILEYREAVTISRCGQSAGKADRTIGTLRDCTPGSDAKRVG